MSVPGAASTSTVQSPHTPCSQATWVPVSARSLRRKSAQRAPFSMSPSRSAPFTSTWILEPVAHVSLLCFPVGVVQVMDLSVMVDVLL